jgi:hypothetical protein
VSLSENNNFKPFSNWAWNYKISCEKIKKLHNAYPPPEGNLATPVKSVENTPDCIIDTPRKHDRPALQNNRIPPNPRKIRKKKKQISPPCPLQTLEPEKTDQTQHLPTNSIRDATASEKINQTQHFPTSETLKPRKDISYLIIDADAVKPNPRARILPNITTVICHTYHPLIPSGLCTRRLRENWLQHNTHARKSESISKTCRATTNLAQQNRLQRAHPSPKHPTLHRVQTPFAVHGHRLEKQQPCPPPQRWSLR